MLQLLPLLPVDLRGNLGNSIGGEEDNDDVSSGGADDDIVDYSDVKHLHRTLRYEMTKVAFRKLLAVCCDQRVLVFPVEPKINKSPPESSISDLEEGLLKSVAVPQDQIIISTVGAPRLPTTYDNQSYPTHKASLIIKTGLWSIWVDLQWPPII